MEHNIESRDKVNPYYILNLFILFVLLEEGEGNWKYHLIRFCLGTKRGAVYYFKKLLQGCDNSSYLYFCDKFYERYKKDIRDYFISQKNMHGILTGRLAILKQE